MKPFAFIRPENLSEALRILNEQEGVLVLNGGTDVMVDINEGKKQGVTLLYVHDLPELKKIETAENAIALGGAVTYTEIEHSPLAAQYVCVAQALRNLASPPIRNMATPAGNIGTASPAGDFNLIMLALDADIQLSGVQGERTLPLNQMFLGVGKTQRAANELITRITIPVRSNRYSSFVKLGRRKGQDISRVSVAAVYSLENGKIADPRIAIGAVNAIPFRSYEFEKMVEGKTVEEAIAALDNTFPPEANPRRAYKKQVVTPMVQRALREAQNQKGE